MAIYNTVDETTNYERLRIQALGANGYNFTVQAGGTGSQRDLIFTTQNSGIRISGGVVIGAINISRNLTGGNGANLGVTGTHSAASGLSNGLAVYNTVSTSGTGGYNGIIVSPAFTSTGSGTHYLLNIGVNGSANGGGPHRPKVTVDTTGNTIIQGNLTLKSIPESSARDSTLQIDDGIVTKVLTSSLYSSGDYTPTITNISNMVNSSGATATYYRIGDRVHIDGSFSVSLTSTVSTTINMSLPFASNFTGITDAKGMCGFVASTSNGGTVTADSTNDLITLNFDATNTSGVVNFSLSYTVK